MSVFCCSFNRVSSFSWKLYLSISRYYLSYDKDFGLGGLRVTCSSRNPRFAGSGCKNPEHKSSGKDFKPWVPSLRLEVREIT